MKIIFNLTDKNNNVLKVGDKVSWCLDWTDSEGKKHKESCYLTIKEFNKEIHLIDELGNICTHLVEKEFITKL